MPKFDGTGPMGQGARTGQGRGDCVDSKQDTNLSENNTEKLLKEIEVLKEEVESLKKNQ